MALMHSDVSSVVYSAALTSRSPVHVSQTVVILDAGQNDLQTLSVLQMAFVGCMSYVTIAAKTLTAKCRPSCRCIRVWPSMALFSGFVRATTTMPACRMAVEMRTDGSSTVFVGFSCVWFSVVVS